MTGTFGDEASTGATEGDGQFQTDKASKLSRLYRTMSSTIAAPSAYRRCCFFGTQWKNASS
jgi:uncharacterized protein YegL